MVWSMGAFDSRQLYQILSERRAGRRVAATLLLAGRAFVACSQRRIRVPAAVLTPLTPPTSSYAEK